MSRFFKDTKKFQSKYDDPEYLKKIGASKEFYRKTKSDPTIQFVPIGIAGAAGMLTASALKKDLLKKKIKKFKNTVAPKPEDRIEKAKGGRADNMPARNKKNFRSTKSGAGMTRAGVASYRRKNPGSKLKTAVTGKVKKGSAAAKRRKSYCARSAGQMKQFPKAAANPNSRLRQARRRWKC